MKTIKLRNKIWKQITSEEYKELEGEKTAILLDNYYQEKTYFKLIKEILKEEEKKAQ